MYVCTYIYILYMYIILKYMMGVCYVTFTKTFTRCGRGAARDEPRRKLLLVRYS